MLTDRFNKALACTNAEDTETKINEALRRGLVKAEIKTKLKLRKEP